MLIGSPLRELGEILEDLERICVKDVGTIFMNKYTIVIIVVVGIPPDMGALLDNEYFLVSLTCKSLSQNATSQARSHD